MTKLHTKQQKLTSRRAVAPVIATLLLVAIAVVGGAIIFVFSQGFFSSAQISGAPQIESLEYIGYDASDVVTLTLHDDNPTNVNDQASNSDGLIAGDRVAVYVQNQSAQKVTLVELSLAGTIYTYNGTQGTVTLDNFDGITKDGGYVIASKGYDDGTTGADIHDDPIPTIQAGEEVSLILQLDRSISQGRDVQVKMETGNGAIFVGTIIAGQQSG